MNTRLKGEWGVVTFSYSIPLTNIVKKEEKGDVVVGWLAGWRWPLARELLVMPYAWVS
jgi:hypothetical protein